MGKTEIITFIILINIIFLILVFSIILFIIQYRQRKLAFESEKKTIQDVHKIELLKTKLESQEETMKLIGQEIHDSVAQKLTLASLYTQKLENEQELNHLTTPLLSISRIINDSLSDLRELSSTLVDNKFQYLGIMDLLKLECAQVNETGICSASLQGQCNSDIPMQIKSSLTRISQEFIQNTLKHAKAKNIHLQITEDAERINITLLDDGIGFDASSAYGDGMGLHNIRRRTEMMNGQLEWISIPGQGTTLHLSIPIVQPQMPTL
jgi:signal transduction histidine kinase